MSENLRDQGTMFNMVDAEVILQDAVANAEARSAELIAAAKAKAEAILKEALSKRDEHVADARVEGFHLGHEEGIKQGRSQGEEDLVAARAEDIRQSAESLASALDGARERLETERLVLLEETRRDVLDLVLQVARVVVGHAAPTPGQQAQFALETLLNEMIDRRYLTVTVHPDVEEAMTTFLPQLKSKIAGIEDIRLMTRDELAPGAVVVANELTEMETSTEDVLERLKTEWGL